MDSFAIHDVLNTCYCYSSPSLILEEPAKSVTNFTSLQSISTSTKQQIFNHHIWENTANDSRRHHVDIVQIRNCKTTGLPN